MSKPRMTGMRKLRKEKVRLQEKIADEKIGLYKELENYKNSLWPFRVYNNFKKTAEALSENKLLIIGAQLAYAALNAKKEKKEETENAEGKHGLVDFLKDVANKFIQQYAKQDEPEKDN